MQYAVPEDLRPAPTGLVLAGRVALGHLAATYIDLQTRGALHIRRTSEGDWELSETGAIALTDWEAVLHRAAIDPAGRGRLSSLDLEGALTSARRQLIRAVIGMGLLKGRRRPVHTSKGLEVQERIRALSVGSRLGSGEALPYAIVLGLLCNVDDGTMADRDEPARLPSRTRDSVEFAIAFIERCKGFEDWRPPGSAPNRHGPSHNPNQHADTSYLIHPTGW